MTAKREFEFAGQAAGCFTCAEWPTAPGVYGYEPYRGGGHYQLSRELGAGRMPVCSYFANGSTVRFVVVRSPAYGLLEIDDLRADRGELPDVHG